ncbi:cellulose biosynthesis protein BcsS [Undibacter mobilis]|uniref:cellulose biosynthesis protein BcsS n=1 Tax=Undibacter mobilis TaxID=2292256 RepID=UPI001AED0D4D|nr:cellulose biosynthesis protein BcsS [Undibacter mobilis]
MFAAAFVACPVAPDARAGEDEDPTTLQFSGRDLWRNGVFAYSGFVYAPGGFDRDGFLLKLLVNSGVFRYWSGSLYRQEVRGAELQTQVLPGFRIKRGTAEMKFFFGPEWQTHWLWPDDPDNKLRGRNFGMRFAAELWSEPTPDTLIAGDVSLGTLATSHTARLAFGWRISGDLFNEDFFYVGPEVQFFDSDGYRQSRIGLHITSMKTGDIEWSAAIGYARDSDGQSSPYVRLGLAQKL